MNRFISLLKEMAKRLSLSLARLFGIRFLDRTQTVVFLQPYEQLIQPESRLSLPAIADPADPATVLFPAREAVAPTGAVWAYKPGNRPTTLLRCGNVQTGGQVLCTDFWNEYLLKDSLTRTTRQRVDTDVLVAPFGHYQDGIAFGGYYDFMYLVAAKLCRIERAVPAHTFDQATVAYPLFNTSYERELLSYLGFQPDRILDSRHHEVHARTTLLANSGHWFYTNEADVRALRDRLMPLVEPSTEPRERIYISRAGRRRVLNEDALVTMLDRYKFRVIEDKPRTLAEQLTIYNRASFVMGPHGASFSNLIWCEPGTHLFELFSPNYTPDFFAYLAELMGLHYSAHAAGKPRPDGLQLLEDDMTVSVSDVERGLNQLLERDYRASVTR
ncbi:hypothetical protein GCM10027578_31720 [Spirosoma luteolum]